MATKKIPLKPYQKTLMVQWGKSPYDGIPVPEGKYASRTGGVVIAISDDLDCADLLGKKVFWEEYKDTVRTEHLGETYAFIKLEDIRGYATR